MKAARILKEKINSGKLTLGVICSDHFWTGMIEIFMTAGLDYCIIDLEHGGYTEETIAEACAIGRRCDFPVLIRPAQTKYDFIHHLADRGPCGFLLPNVADASVMDEVQQALYMPPRGNRRPGGPGNRWCSDVTKYQTWIDDVENDWIVLPQIERKAALDHAEAIAAHQMTTAMAVGPYDLSADLGCCWDPQHPDLQAALKTIKAAGEKAGKKCWMIGDAHQLQKDGYNLICFTEPTLFMQAMLKAKVEEFHAGTANAGTPDPEVNLP